MGISANPAEHRVFISYASADQAVAQQICEALEGARMSCWIAPRNIPAGADFPSAILEGIASAQAMVAIVSPNAVTSPHVLSEIGHAFNKKKPIVPLRLAAVALPEDFDYYLSMRQWLDAPQGITADVLPRVVAAVRDAIAGRQQYESEPVSRRWPVWTAAALVLALTGAVAYFKWSQPSTNRLVREKRDKTTLKRVDKKVDRTEREVRKEWVNPKDGQTYLWIAAGSFTMGCSPSDDQCAKDEKPAHRVDLTEGFWLAKTETTEEAYRKAHGSAAGHAKGDPRLPIRGLDWKEAKAYCASVDGRLPFEAEWEYAARGGSSEPYYGTPSKIAWYEADSDDTIHPVGMKEPNNFGLYDMLGNVSEWVSDRYYNRYDLEAPAVGPHVEQPLRGNASAVARGGFWGAELKGIRVSHRSEVAPDEAAATVGVRCASDHR